MEPYCRHCLAAIDLPPVFRPTARQRVLLALLEIPRGGHVDHIAPKGVGVRAGAEDAAELQSLCHPCHSRKTMAEQCGRAPGRPPRQLGVEQQRQRSELVRSLGEAFFPERFGARTVPHLDARHDEFKEQISSGALHGR